MNLKEQIDTTKLPQHLAIIMDGNGRWAKQKGFLRTIGHENGVQSVRSTLTLCAELGIKYLTLYAFSSENWQRPRFEVEKLMEILIKSLKKELPTFNKNGIAVKAIGNLDLLPKKVQEQLYSVIENTKDNAHMTLTLALSYGSRDELINAVKEISYKVKNSLISEADINELIINEHLYTKGIPDVDLLIRTSGEQRISNFLLWQLAYAELYFTEVLWPDFSEEELCKALLTYQTRERRFGKTSEQIK